MVNKKRCDLTQEYRDMCWAYNRWVIERNFNLTASEFWFLQFKARYAAFEKAIENQPKWYRVDKLLSDAVLG